MKKEKNWVNRKKSVY